MSNTYSDLEILLPPPFSWHTLTVLHSGKDVSLQLDSRWQSSLESPGPHHHLHLDPEIYIGAAPSKAKGRLP